MNFTYRKTKGLLAKKLTLKSQSNSQTVGYAICQQLPKVNHYCYATTVVKTDRFEGKDLYDTANILVKGNSERESQKLMKERLSEIIAPHWKEYYERIGNTFSFKKHEILHSALQRSVRCSNNINALNLQIIVTPNIEGKPFAFPVSKVRAW